MSSITELLGVIRRGDTKAVGDMLSANPELANTRDEQGTSPVRQHVRAGSPRGHTPLHEAAFNGDVALARTLLDNGADRSLPTGDGQTALEIARQHGRHEVAGLLGG